ncbi:MAG TPA: hypothetical protein VFX83_08350 [Azonexus sp.]|nr:hypothetical protein [Azonexus sp.]
MNPHIAWLRRPVRTALFLFATLGAGGASLAAPPADPGRLFYTPAQRAQLEAARVRNVTQDRHAAPDVAPPPMRFDGMVIRSDGKGTRWVNGQPQVGASGVADLKPGQILSNGKVYEPYQVLRPSPAPALAKEPRP